MSMHVLEVIESQARSCRAANLINVHEGTFSGLAWPVFVWHGINGTTTLHYAQSVLLIG